MPWATILWYPTMLSHSPFTLLSRTVHEYAAALSLLAEIKLECFDYFLK